MSFEDTFGVTIPFGISACVVPTADSINCDEVDEITGYRMSQLADKYNKAEIVPGYSGWIFTAPKIGKYSADGFFPSVEECLIWCAENEVDPPEFAFCCDSDVPHFIDYDELVQEQVFIDSFEEAWEHVGDEAESEFRNAIDKFNEHISKILTYSPDFTRKVRVKPL